MASKSKPARRSTAPSRAKPRPTAAKKPAAKPVKKAPAKLPAKPTPKVAAKAPAKAPAKPAAKPGAKRPAAPTETIPIPLRGDGRRHMLSLSFLRDGDEFLARLETDAGQITELKNRALDQLLTLVAGELEDLLE